VKQRYRLNALVVVVVSFIIAIAVPAQAQIGGRPGAFSRLGFGARGMGMGNAQTAVITGDLVGYYNPAVIPFAEFRYGAATYGVLSLDRILNFISYTQAVKPSAGISAGIINSGVSDIDGRDSDGEHTEMLSTSENQVFLSFANRFPAGFSVGIAIKLLYHKLYTDVTTTTVGIDFGAVMPIGESVTVGAAVRDVNSKYKWDTSTLYGQSGNSTADAFPILYSLGGSYKLPDSLGLVAVDIEASDRETLVARFGLEAPLIPELSVRAGVDRIDLKEKGNGVKPTFGFSARKSLSGWTPAVHYAFIVEPFSSSGMHIISLSVIF